MIFSFTSFTMKIVCFCSLFLVDMESPICYEFTKWYKLHYIYLSRYQEYFGRYRKIFVHLIKLIASANTCQPYLQQNLKLKLNSPKKRIPTVTASHTHIQNIDFVLQHFDAFIAAACSDVISRKCVKYKLKQPKYATENVLDIVTSLCFIYVNESLDK